MSSKSYPSTFKPKIIFIVGPTCVGKSEVAVYLAQRINAEIVSCDSMQIYRGMNIVTSLPTASLRKKVPHHLIACVSPKEEYNVSRYRRQALLEIKRIIKRGKTPLFVGGTGLYMSILIDGIFEVEAQNKNLRKRLYSEAAESSSKILYNRLKEVDPAAAAKIHPNDTKRIIRALEVYTITGRPISELQKTRQGLTDEFDIRIFCLNLEREKLYQRIEMRVEKMFRQGLVREIKKLLRLPLSRTAYCAIGVREVEGYLKGEYDLEEAKKMLKRNTCLYAKRQLSWFRRDKRIEWIQLDGRESPQDVAAMLVKRLKER